MRLARDLARISALFGAVTLSTAAGAAVVAPKDNDPYSRWVAQAEADDPTVDFHALRIAWLTSAASTRAPPTAGLRQAIIAAVAAHDIQGARLAAETALSFNYTDLYAHGTRREACQLSGDRPCERHEQVVEDGLIASIKGGKDGQTMGSAWEAVAVDEEYFLLSVTGLRPSDQGLMMQGPRQYDHFHVTDPQGRRLDVYFDITLYWQKTYGALR